MKNQPIPCLFFLLGTLLALSMIGCASSVSDTHTLPHRSQESEFTGILQVSDSRQCRVAEDCEAQFSLLGRNLKAWIALEGHIVSSHHHLIITVTGQAMPLPTELVGQPGYENIRTLVAVKHYRVRSKIPYLPFLADSATDYTLKTFGCDLAWDKSPTWEIKDDNPNFTIRMTDTQRAAPQPWIQLSYNGNSGKLIAATSALNQANPCAEVLVNHSKPTAISSTIWFIRVGVYFRAENVASVFTKLTKHGFKVRKSSVSTDQGNATYIWLGPYTKQQTATAVSLRMQALIGEKGLISKALIGTP